MKKPSNPHPPRWADRLLEWFCAPHLLEEIQGDLYERFQRQVTLFGERSARQQYTWAVISFIRPFALKRNPNPYPNTLSTRLVMISNYFKIAWRNLIRNKVSALINLTGLTLGISACLVIGVITHFELSYDRFHPDSERIYRVIGTAKFNQAADAEAIGFVPRAVPQALRNEISGFEVVATFHNMESGVIIPNGSKDPKVFKGRDMDIEPAQIVLADPEYFEVFRYKWLAGSPQTALTDPFQVVISERKARLYFGALPLSSILGKEIIYRDSIRTTVSGIVADWKQNSDFTFTDFISSATIRASFLKREINLDEWTDIWSGSQTFVKLTKGNSKEKAVAQLATFGKKHFGPNRGTGEFKFKPSLQPLSDLHFNEVYQDNYSRKASLPTLYGLIGIALFILLIAAINFINLATAQSVRRSREVGVRKALGSNRGNLIGQFMSETLILTLCSVLIALGLAKPLLFAFRSFIPAGVQFSFFNPGILLFLLVITLVTVFLAGFYPSVVLSAFRPALALKGASATSGQQKGYLRKGLIVFQFTISLLFIIATLIVGRQLSFIRNKDLGFSSDAVVTISTLRDDKSAVLAQKIRQISDIEQVAMQWSAPLSDWYMLSMLTYEGKSKIDLEVSAKVGDEHFIPLYQFNLLAGRNLEHSDTLKELVVNATLVKKLGFKTNAAALGKLVMLNNRKYPIVGVISDFHENSLHALIKPTVIAYIPDMAKDLAVRLSTKGKKISDLGPILAKLQKNWHAVYPNEPFVYSFLDDSIQKLYSREQKTAQLVNTASAIAILISCLGLLGLATFTAEQRTKEIGVRKVLGASISSIIALLSKDFLVLVLIALCIASPIAWWAMSKWLTGFAYHVNLEWWVFVLAGLMAIGVALLTVSYHSIKAALRNPTESLKSE
jgi:ABC-type antimicrobial peptide transport system permease subunit